MSIVIYVGIAIGLGVYGLSFTAFSPKHHVLSFAKYSTIAFFMCLWISSVAFIASAKERIATQFKSRFRFYLFIFAGLPLLSAALAFFHFSAVAKGAPSLITYVISDGQFKTVLITGKRLWGKRDRNEEVRISGYDVGFPVSRAFYDAVEEGDSVTVVIRQSALGDNVRFLRPRRRVEEG